MTREEEAGGKHSERHQAGPSRRQPLTPLWFLMCITRITQKAQLTGAPRDSVRSRHTAPAPLLYLLHPSRFSESTGCLWLAKVYLPTPEGISTWVGPTALSGKPPLDSVQIQKCQESEISTSSRWSSTTPPLKPGWMASCPGSLRQRQARLEGQPGCQRSKTPHVCWKHTEQNDHAFSAGDGPPRLPSALLPSTLSQT